MEKKARVNHTLSKDGSSTLWAPDFDEHYHSIHGALTESMHVFIEAGLKEKEGQEGPLYIFEMGLGTGLNVLLTMIQEREQPVYYHSIELYPLLDGQWKELNYEGQISSTDEKAYLELIHTADWDNWQELTPHFYFKKEQRDLLDFEPDHLIDLVYFDAFAPSSQPELWTPEVMARIFSFCREGAVFTTYSAKGDVRRALLGAGFEVEKIPGPPGKREMLRARKPLPLKE
ncbi:MAG: tRNA (5-methylaminomethyl-2-thiouridine)(34)-methyltransferase MnmD [Bacteroidota bacterium]